MMIYQILDLILGIASTLIAGACLMLCYLDYFRINLGRMHGTLGNQITSYLMLAGNWLTEPLRKVVKSNGKVELVYLLSAFLIVLAKVFVLTIVSNASLNIIALVLAAVIQTVGLFLSIFSGLTFIYVIVSWIAPTTPGYLITAQILEPILQIIREKMPNFGAIDLSPLFLLVGIKVLQIVLSNLN